MPDAEYTTTARLPVERIWSFVEDMDNWAEYVAGYQSHEKLSDTESLWVLKGDVGVLQRTLKFKVLITEWNGPSRVAFELEGLNEQMTGSGSFEMESYTEAAAEPGAAEAPRKGFLLRWLEAIVRFFLGLFRGRPERAASAGAGPGAGMAKLTFRLSLVPGGPMAPMVNAMMKPIMLPTAEDLANKIMARVEELQGAKS